MCNNPLKARLPSIEQPALILLVADEAPLFINFTEDFNAGIFKR